MCPWSFLGSSLLIFFTSKKKKKVFSFQFSDKINKKLKQQQISSAL